MVDDLLVIASDHKCFPIGTEVIRHTCLLGFKIEDIRDNEGAVLDIVDTCKQLNEKMSGQGVFGIIISNDAHGMVMASNKFQNIRAALCSTPEDARKARHRLNINVLCIQGSFISQHVIIEIVNAFLDQSFDSDQYKKMVEKLNVYPTQHATNGVNIIVRAIITHKGRVLLSTTTKSNREYAQNLYFLPGGHVDYAESATDAIRRELLEEMSLIPISVGFVGVLECTWNKKSSIYHELNLVYKVNLKDLSLHTPPVSNEPFIEFVWCPVQDLSKYTVLPNKLKPMIEEALDVQENALFYSQMIKNSS